MSEYGLTAKGLNIKRLDVILEEMQTALSEKWGVNVRQNPKSFLNVHLTDLADHLAELWELGQDVYNAQYPLTAEGMYLDGVGQFAGLWRETDAPSYYHILCTGVEGTVIPADTLISTETNPVTFLVPTKENTISRSNFNTALIKVATMDGNPLTVALDGTVYSYTPESGDTENSALEKLAARITDGYTGEMDSDTGYLLIRAAEVNSVNTMVLSDNLTTDRIGCVFTFETKEAGDIYLPEGTVNQISKSVPGLSAVVNVGSYIAGRVKETDAEYRASYAEKIFSHSSRMIDSIRSAILANCQGVTSVSVYENVSNETDSAGRYPHSIEVVVDGGDSTEIAQQILNTKAGGISTFGSTSVDIAIEEGNEITIRFNRPNYLKVWFHVSIVMAKYSTLPVGYSDMIRSLILDAMSTLQSGDDVNPQSLMLASIYQNVTGIGYVEITIGTVNEKPSEFTEHNIYCGARDRAVTEESMIEVVINE